MHHDLIFLFTSLNQSGSFRKIEPILKCVCVAGGWGGWGQGEGSFPGGLLAQTATLRSQCKGSRFDPWLEN